jgi:diacylglycerol O-acyltransferase
VGAPRVKKGDLTVMTREMLATMAALGGGLIKSNTKIAKIMMDAWKKQRVSTFRSKLYYAPPSLLNQRITGSRRFVADSFSLERIKAAGKAFGGSINDCLVAMTGYALRKYLRGLKKLPRGSLITALPVNLREDDSLGGNQVGMIRVTLGTNISQTARRLKAITDSVAEQKAILKSLSKEEKLIYSAVSLAPSGLQLGTGLFPQFQTFNVVISNVPGPKERLYWNGLELDALYPVSIPVHQAAMNITIFSYADKIEIGIIACRNALPSIQRLIDYMHEGLADIERVTGLTKKGR